MELKRKIVFENKSLDPVPVVFLDRDGVLIQDKNHIRDPLQVELCEGVIQLLEYIHSINWRSVIVTNQSGISRGYFSWENYQKVTNRLLEIIDNDKLISAIYANGYKFNSQSSWRKPNAGMLIQASKDINIDLQRSIIVGDRFTDLQAGQKAGLNKFVHVLTGHGLKERKKFCKKYNLELERKLELDFQKIYFIDSLKNFPFEIVI